MATTEQEQHWRETVRNISIATENLTTTLATLAKQASVRNEMEVLMLTIEDISWLRITMERLRTTAQVVQELCEHSIVEKSKWVLDDLGYTVSKAR